MRMIMDDRSDIEITEYMVETASGDFILLSPRLQRSNRGVVVSASGGLLILGPWCVAKMASGRKRRTSPQRVSLSTVEQQRCKKCLRRLAWRAFEGRYDKPVHCIASLLLLGRHISLLFFTSRQPGQMTRNSSQCQRDFYRQRQREIGTDLRLGL